MTARPTRWLGPTWLALWFGPLSAWVGCGAPCTADSGCANGQYCGADGDCRADCIGSDDCEPGELCQLGRCWVGFRPQVEWLAPAPETIVGDDFDAVARVRFRGETAHLRLVRDPQTGGDACVPLVVEDVYLDGPQQGETLREVTFRGVPALGARFGLQVVASVGGVEARAARAFRGTAQPGFGGVEILAPGAVRLDADLNYAFDADVLVAPFAERVSAFVAPFGAEASVRALVATEATGLATFRAPLARGLQVLWVESFRNGQSLRCGVALQTAPPAVPGDLEFALSFSADEPNDLNLWLVHEDGEGQTVVCHDGEPPFPCLGARAAHRDLTRYGERAIYAAQAEGIYGIAVLPGAAVGSTRAWVRLSARGTHVAWVGPRTLQTAQGQVWLAARVLLLDGQLRVDPVDRVDSAIPGPPSTW